MTTPPGLVLLRLRLLQVKYALRSLPWYYQLLVIPAVLGILYGVCLAAIAHWEVWVIITVFPLLLHFLREDHFSVLRRLKQPFWAAFWESTPVWMLATFIGYQHHPFFALLPPLVMAVAVRLPPPRRKSEGVFFMSVPGFLKPWFTREARVVWHTQAPWLLLIMLLSLPALFLPVLSLWLTLLLTLLWSGPILRSESWIELRSSGLSGAFFFFHQVWEHARPLLVWSLLMAVLHGWLQPEVEWLSLLLPLLQMLYLLAMWSMRYANWRPSEVSSAQLAASLAAIGLIVPVMAPVIPLFLVYYLPKALFRLRHELLP